MAGENPSWGEGRIADELSVKLGLLVNARYSGPQAKQRYYYPMLGFSAFIRRNASVACSKSCGNISVRDVEEGNSYQPLETRPQFVTRVQALEAMFVAA